MQNNNLAIHRFLYCSFIKMFDIYYKPVQTCQDIKKSLQIKYCLEYIKEKMPEHTAMIDIALKYHITF